MYQRRYERGMEELEIYSRVQHDTSESIFKPNENFVAELEFVMPQSSLKIYIDQIEGMDLSKKPIFYSAFEGLIIKMRSESVP